MPTFTETRDSFLQLRTDLKAIIDTVNVRHPLGQGYEFVIQTKELGGQPQIDIRMEGGRSKDINEIPLQVLNKYRTAILRYNEWKNDLVPDFPNFSDI